MTVEFPMNNSNKIIISVAFDMTWHESMEGLDWDLQWVWCCYSTDSVHIFLPDRIRKGFVFFIELPLKDHDKVNESKENDNFFSIYFMLLSKKHWQKLII